MTDASMTMAPATSPRTALLLPGGGARAAYQVGVLKALSELHGAAPNPFPVICGTSAGAINAIALASRADRFAGACSWLEALWKGLTPERIYRTDWPAILGNSWRLLLSLFNTGIAVGRPVALLDNAPLRQLLAGKVAFDQVGEHIRDGHLEAVCVTAMNYTEGLSTSFFQGGLSSGWRRWRRQGVPTPLGLQHLMASTAIPTVFPPEKIGRDYYGDGALRQLTPISPALHLNADRVFIIPANGHRRDYGKPLRPIRSPAFGQIIGHLLSSAFIDSLETDIELLERINQLIRELPPEHLEHLDKPLRPIDVFILSPSQDLDTLAEAHARELPRSLRSFLRVTGSNRYQGGVNVASYLLFTPGFINELIELGYADAMAQAQELSDFIGCCGSNVRAQDDAPPEKHKQQLAAD